MTQVLQSKIMSQVFVVVQLQWPLRETIFSFYQKLLVRYTCLETVFCNKLQYCKKMLQALENKECLELLQLGPRSISTLQSHQRWEDIRLGNVFTAMIGMENTLSTRPW